MADHRITIETDVSSWTKVRTICGCGFVGEWRGAGVYVEVDEHGHEITAAAS